MDTEAGDLLADGFEDALQGVLAAAVGGDAGEGGQAAHGGDGQDVSAAPCAHERQNGVRGGGGAEDIDVELSAQIGQGRFLEGAFQAVPGVRDQHVDGAHVLLHLADHGEDRFVVGDVEKAGVGTLGVQSGERSRVGVLADGADDGVSGVQGARGEGAAETAADAGDEEDLGGGHQACSSLWFSLSFSVPVPVSVSVSLSLSRYRTRCSWKSTPSRMSPVAVNPVSSTYSRWWPVTV